MDHPVQMNANPTVQQIHPSTRVSYAHLRVKDLEKEIAFYQEALGFELNWRDGQLAGLGTGKEDILRLTGDHQATLARRTAGLYHFAVLMPSRLDLSHSLNRLVQSQIALQGAADHWFSEAIYLADPEGNGIELYRDRPREEWPPMEEILQRGNGYFDLRQLLSEIPAINQETKTGLDPNTLLGHIHLRVSDVTTSNAFYLGVLGFEKMMEMPEQAGFVSAGGYHHHIAYNVWQGRGMPPAPEGSAGLESFAIELPDSAAREAVIERLDKYQYPFDETSEGFLVRDPSGIKIILTIPKQTSTH